MKTPLRLLLTVAILNLAWWLVPLATASDSTPVRLLIVTGGHDFETNAFFQMFKDNPDVRFEAVQHPNAHAKLKGEAAKNYDVIVLYDMWQPITEEAKADFVALLKSGKGLVALHHCVGSYQKWDEYARIVGAKYVLEKHAIDGAERPPSSYKHDVDFRVQVASPQHPVTRGLSDFDIHDETYGGLYYPEGITPLLTAKDPTSSPTVAWVSGYRQARVVGIQLGHDHLAYENPSYRRLVAQAIRWVANKD